MVNLLLKRRQLENYSFNSGNWVFLTNGDKMIKKEQYLGAWHFIVLSHSFGWQNPMAMNEIWQTLNPIGAQIINT